MTNASMRFLFSFMLITVVILIALVGLSFWPVTTIKIDPEKTPFMGVNQVNSFTMYTNIITDASGRFRTHKIILLFLAITVLLGGIFNHFFNLTKPIKVFLHIPSDNIIRSRLFFSLMALGFLIPLIISLKKIPDFSQNDDAHMAVTNMHFAFIIGHADKLSHGDKLFETVSPKYGMLITVLIAGLEKAKGTMLSIGTIMKMVQISEVIYLFIAILLYWRWSGRRWIVCIIPTLFLIKWFYSSSHILVPINHSPIRTAGITLAIFCLYYLKGYPFRYQSLASGGLTAIALLNNVESGLACSIGILAFLFLRGKTFTKPLLQAWFPIVLFYGVGFIATWVFFSLICFMIFGVHFGFDGVQEYVLPAFRGASGSWATNDPLGWWPILMFLHVSFILVYSALAIKPTFKDAFRCTLGVIFVTWFAYFINRPEQPYLCSFYFLYGFFIVDCQQNLLKTIRTKNVFPVHIGFLSLILILIISQAIDAINWNINPFDWKINNFARWQVPLVKKGKPSNNDSVLSGNVYISHGYANILFNRGRFLKDKAKIFPNNRLVYFTVDSFLIPRVSGVLPWQEFPDPLEAMTKKHYDKNINSIINSPFDEIYFDARDEKKLIWYGAMFQMVRKDLSSNFEKVGIESGWEIWRRITPKT